MIKQFITRVLLCCITVVLLLIPVELLLRAIPNTYSYKKDYLDRNAGSIKTLILGSSHSYFGINPDLLDDSAFNAANSSQSLYFDFRIFQLYANSLNNLETLIIPVSYPSLFYDLDAWKHRWYIKNYVLYFKIRDVGNPMCLAELVNIRQPVWDQLYRYYRYNHSLVNCSPAGFGLEYQSFAPSGLGDLETSGKKAAAWQTVDNFNEVIRIRKYLENILAIARKKNCRVILFTPPAFYTYRERLSRVQLERMQAEISALLHTYSNVSYVNYLDDTSFVRGDYFDADHLNETGSRKLTRKIAGLMSSQQKP